MFKDQLLHAPIEQLRHVQFILRRAGYLVNPAELAELFAGFTEYSQHLAFECHLINPAWEGVGSIEDLIRTWSDTDSPGRARRHCAVCLRRFVADRWLGIRIDWNIDGDLAQKFSLGIEYLDSAIATICNVDVVLRVDGHTVRSVELPGPITEDRPKTSPNSHTCHTSRCGNLYIHR